MHGTDVRNRPCLLRGLLLTHCRQPLFRFDFTGIVFHGDLMLLTVFRLILWCPIENIAIQSLALLQDFSFFFFFLGSEGCMVQSSLGGTFNT